MKILVALDNKEIKEKIDEIYNQDVYEYDITTKENVIEFLSNTKDDYIVITKEDLNGNLDGKLYIKHLKLARSNLKIIYIVKKLDDEYKKFLFANEVFNILEGDIFDINDILDAIKEDKMVIYNNKYNKDELQEECLNEYLLDVNILKKQIVAIYGTSGAGKSILSSIIAKNVAKYTHTDVALLDMDIENSAIDIINNVEESNSLMQIVEDVDKTYKVEGDISKYVVNDKVNKNLAYVTNNCSIYDVQNRLSNKYYNKIYSSLYSKYDYLFIDLPASPFLDVVQYSLNVATKIFFVVNANYISIRQAVKYINLITKFWDNDNSKIYIIVNKVQNNSLETSQIESLLGGYKIIAEIEYNKNMESYINGAFSDIDVKLNMDKIYEVLGIKMSSNLKRQDKNKFILKFRNK